MFKALVAPNGRDIGICRVDDDGTFVEGKIYATTARRISLDQWEAILLPQVEKAATLGFPGTWIRVAVEAATERYGGQIHHKAKVASAPPAAPDQSSLAAALLAALPADQGQDLLWTLHLTGRVAAAITADARRFRTVTGLANTLYAKLTDDDMELLRRAPAVNLRKIDVAKLEAAASGQGSPVPDRVLERFGTDRVLTWAYGTAFLAFTAPDEGPLSELAAAIDRSE